MAEPFTIQALGNEGAAPGGCAREQDGSPQVSLAEHASPKANGHGGPFAGLRMPSGLNMQDFVRSPTVRVPLPSKKGDIQLGTDRVRAKPAVTPQISMMIGMTAIGLGMWGTMFPKSVGRALGIKASTSTIRTLFGARELASGYGLAGDPTKAGLLWARVGADIFDIAVLRGLDRRSNPKRGNAKLALGFVLAVTALDLVTAVRMTNVKRNCV